MKNNNYRDLLFITIIVLVFFSQLFFKSFYTPTFQADLYKTTEAEKLKIAEMKDVIHSISKQEGYKTKGEWLHGKDFESIINSNFWKGVDTTLYIVAQKAYDDFLQEKNVIYCEGQYLILEDIIPKVVLYEIDDLDFYYNETPNFNEDFIDYELCIYPKDLSATITNWFPQSSQNFREYNSNSPDRDVIHYDDYKISTWQFVKMLRVLYSVKFRIYLGDFSYKYLNSNGVYNGTYKASYIKGTGGIDCPPAKKPKDLQKPITTLSQRYSWGFKTSKDKLDSRFCKKLNYTPKK